MLLRLMFTTRLKERSLSCNNSCCQFRRQFLRTAWSLRSLTTTHFRISKLALLSSVRRSCSPKEAKKVVFTLGWVSLVARQIIQATRQTKWTAILRLPPTGKVWYSYILQQKKMTNQRRAWRPWILKLSSRLKIRAFTRRSNMSWSLKSVKASHYLSQIPTTKFKYVSMTRNGAQRCRKRKKESMSDGTIEVRSWNGISLRTSTLFSRASKKSWRTLCRNLKCTSTCLMRMMCLSVSGMVILVTSVSWIQNGNGSSSSPTRHTEKWRMIMRQVWWASRYLQEG